ncbi:MAG TPA: RNA polymerase sigma factor [Gammaproteobacteria bacterium]|nr:RNA polymerase sigma factor [Gammaproteobacteria bacterium]
MISEVAFAELYRTHYSRVLGLCRHLLGSRAAAEDAAQEAFFRAHRTLASYDAGQPFQAWIMSIATHHCIDIVRRRSKERAIFGTETTERVEAEADTTDVLGELLAAERARDLKAAVAALPDKYRLPLLLAYYGGSSYDEIATTLGLTKTHVGALICRGKQALRKALTSLEEKRA